MTNVLYLFVYLLLFFSQHENKTIEITIELSYFFFLVRALNRKLSVFLVLKRKYIRIKNHNFRTRYHRNLIIISFNSQENKLELDKISNNSGYRIAHNIGKTTLSVT